MFIRTGHTLSMHTVRCGTSACTQHSFTSAIRAVCSAFARLRPHLPCMGLAWASPPAWVHAHGRRSTWVPSRKLIGRGQPSKRERERESSISRERGVEGGALPARPDPICDATRARAHRGRCMHHQNHHTCLPTLRGRCAGPSGESEGGGGQNPGPTPFLADSGHVGHTRDCLHTQSASGTSQHHCYLPPPAAGPARGPAGRGEAVFPYKRQPLSSQP